MHFSEGKVMVTSCQKRSADQAPNGINVQVIRSYSWAAVQSQQNSQRKPVNNCGGSHDFSETLVSNLEK